MPRSKGTTYTMQFPHHAYIFVLLLVLSFDFDFCDEARTPVQSHTDHPTKTAPQDTSTITTHHNRPATSETTGNKSQRFKVAAVDFAHVSAPYVIALWIIIAGLAKIGFHVTPRLRSLCPESCVLLLIGVAIGCLLYFTGLSGVGPLTPTAFFLFMLPPIVLDAGYFMPNRLFFDNLITILLYAVLGTVWNSLSIGLSLWGVGLTGMYERTLPLLDALLFSSIVSAVDPVAVLAVFEEIHVNEVLYIIVFGESLLNDAVTVVLYHMFEGYTEMGADNILPVDYAAGVASFFVVAVGGTIVGIIFGIAAAFLSRFTHHVDVIEPLFVFVMAYLSYLTAEIFHLSGIMALTFCGITMKNYVEENISQKSHVTVKYTMKMLASTSETIIFVLLGVSTVNDKHEWNTSFVLFTIFFCTLYRSLGIIMLTALANRFRLHQFNKVEQFIMSYGGLRGAVAFALALIIDENVIPSKNMMVTTIISVVYFTVFVQGMTIGFFVNILNVSKSHKEQLSMNERLHCTVIDHLMAGIEGISDLLLGNYKIRDKFKHYNNKYFRPILTNNAKIQEPKIFETHSRLNLNDAVNMVKNSGNVIPMVSPDAGISLSRMFKSYTQSNLTKLAPDEIPQQNNTLNLLNVDMGELSYNPSFKDLADAEIHHILEDSMFKPPKRSRRYSRSQFEEIQPKHPPFHHHMRLQIRRLVSESSKHRKRHRNQSPNGCAVSDNKQLPITIPLQTARSYPQLMVTAAPDETEITEFSTNETSAFDDDGITFTAHRNSIPLEPELKESRTLTETILPWKRDDDIDEQPARPQQEFPTWVDNREYYPGYLSPTNTFLEGIGSASSKERRPSLFEVFSSTHTIHESIDERDEIESLPGECNITREQELSDYDSDSVFAKEDKDTAGTGNDTLPNTPEPSTSFDQQKTSIRDSGERDSLVKEAATTAAKSFAVCDPDEPILSTKGRYLPGDDEASTSHEGRGSFAQQEEQEKTPQFLTSPKSPDNFSVITIPSEVSPRRGSADTISIECPDVALDIEGDGEGDTKL